MAKETVQPRPTPITFETGHTVGPDGRGWVWMKIHSATGMQVYFVQPDFIDAICDGLRKAQRSARAPGLVVPGLHVVEGVNGTGSDGS